MSLNKYNLKEIKTAEELFPVYKEVHNMLLQKKYEEINNFLKSIDLESSTVLILMGLLRLTYMWQNDLPYWKEHLENVKNELIKREEDYKSILVGLI